jgi:hypothetical protein
LADFMPQPAGGKPRQTPEQMAAVLRFAASAARNGAH